MAHLRVTRFLFFISLFHFMFEKAVDSFFFLVFSFKNVSLVASVSEFN